MSAEEYRHWLEFTSTEPLPAARHDYGLAQIAAILANVNRARNAPAYRLSDFTFDPDIRKHDADDDEESLEDFARALGAEFHQ